MSVLDFFAWQRQKEDRRSGRATVPLRTLPPEPVALEGDTIDVEEHHASTTIVQRIREAMSRKIRGERS